MGALRPSREIILELMDRQCPVCAWVRLHVLLKDISRV